LLQELQACEFVVIGMWAFQYKGLMLVTLVGHYEFSHMY